MINEQATRNLNNFVSSYTLPESNKMLVQVYDQITKGKYYSAMINKNEEQILNFLESLEELLPAIYGLYEKLTNE